MTKGVLSAFLKTLLILSLKFPLAKKMCHFHKQKQQYQRGKKSTYDEKNVLLNANTLWIRDVAAAAAEQQEKKKPIQN